MVRTKQSPRRGKIIRGGEKNNALVKSASQKKRAKPGSRALKEIRNLQNTTNLLIPRAPFIRMVNTLVKIFLILSNNIFILLNFLHL